MACLRFYRGPKLRIYDVRVEGPHIEQWPSAGHRLMYGDLQPDDLNRSTITQRLRVFAAGAFRRPLRSDELKPIERMVTGKLADGMEPLAALQLGFQTIPLLAVVYLHAGGGGHARWIQSGVTSVVLPLVLATGHAVAGPRQGWPP